MAETINRLQTPSLETRLTKDQGHFRGHGQRPWASRDELLPAEELYLSSERRVAYWCRLTNGGIGMVTIRDERIRRIDRFRGGGAD